MGLFFGNIKRQPLSELQVDGKEIEDDKKAAATDYTQDDDNPENLAQANPAGDPVEKPAPKEEPAPVTAEPEDYTIPDEADKPAAAEATPAKAEPAPANEPAATEEPTDYTQADDTATPPTEDTADANEPTDYTQTEDEPATDDEADKPTDDAAAAEGDTTKTTPEDSGATDYTQDDGNTDDTADSAPTSRPTATNDTPGQTESEIREIEAELFSNLSAQQIAIKNTELKNQYIKMFDVTSSLIDKINDVPKNDQTTKILEFVSDKLVELRQMMADYIANVFSTLSYMENAINYNKHLAVLNGINKILSELVAKSK